MGTAIVVPFIVKEKILEKENLIKSQSKCIPYLTPFIYNTHLNLCHEKYEVTFGFPTPFFIDTCRRMKFLS